MEELQPGYRFYPTEEELVSFYLHHKLQGTREEDVLRVIPVVNVFSTEPWHIPKLAGELCQGDTEQWFFFTPRQPREADGGRPCRTTASGYWKATGSPCYVYSSTNRVIGVNKTMVFYKGRAPTGRKTKWKMNEYRAIEGAAHPSSTSKPQLRQEFRLCRIYVISGSFRAFDRRPLEAVRRDTRVAGEGSAISPCVSTVLETATSSETSHSGGDQAHLPETTGETVGDLIDGLEQPLWEWEPLLDGYDQGFSSLSLRQARE